jgi:hypothetical protein
MKIRTKKLHPLEWLFEPLEGELTFVRRKMFGCEAAYLDGKLVLVLAAGEEPWNGVMIPTEREFHSSVIQEWPSLRSHKILGKWLYLSQTHRDFEGTATAVVGRILARDPRFGTNPKPRKKRRSRRDARHREED